MTVQAITVFMGSQLGNQSSYITMAKQLGQTIAQRRLKMIYGGGRDGLMGIAARSAMAEGGEVVGISPNNLAEEAIAIDSVTKLIEVADMDERKRLLMAYADAFIALPGGFGTLEEIAQVISWEKIGLHHKPLVLLNTNGFYDSLWHWLMTSVSSGFVAQNDLAKIYLADTVESALTYLINESDR